VQDELAKLDAEVEARHARELQQLDAATAAAASSAAAPANPAAAAVVDRASKYLKDLSLGASAAAAADGDDAQDEHEVAGRTKVCLFACFLSPSPLPFHPLLVLSSACGTSECTQQWHAGVYVCA
jgi:hypothetical protein